LGRQNLDKFRYFQPDDIAKVGQPLIDIEVPEISVSESEDAAEIKSEEKNGCYNFL
jgi:hypothetical protein